MTIKTLKKLIVPLEQECIFVSPDYKNWGHLLNKNAISFPNMISTQLLDIAFDYTQQIGLLTPYIKKQKKPIVTGHQPSWHHCGIFAKNIVTTNFAKNTKRIPLHLVLDHDICETQMLLPQKTADGFLYFEKLALETAQQNIPLELRPLPPKEHLKNFLNSITEDKFSFCYEIWSSIFYNILKNTNFCRNIADLITQLQALLNQALGIWMVYLPVSLMSQSEPFINFLFEIILDAVNFAQIYNEVINEQRQITNSASCQTLRPLEIDLKNKVIELPFWLISSTGKRLPLLIAFNNEKITLRTATDTLGYLDSQDKPAQLREILNASNYFIRPKAVTLTLFVRLYLADFFIHGIGGAKYELITDNLITKYYRLSRLYFGIVTATMFLPIEMNNHCLTLTETQLKSQIREIKFNPEKFIGPLMISDAKIKSLLDSKKDYIEITHNNHLASSKRKLAWLKLKNINEELLKYTDQEQKNLIKDNDILTKHRISMEVIKSREHFLGLFSKQRLEDFTNLKEAEYENSSDCCPSS